jgi:hypothetical protein
MAQLNTHNRYECTKCVWGYALLEEDNQIKCFNSQFIDANNYYEGGSNNRNIDNKFGKNSKAAWNKFVASGIMGKNRDQEIYEEK